MTTKFMFVFAAAMAFNTFAWAGIAAIPTKYKPLPTGYTHGSKITLDCGTTYTGTLEVSNLSNVVVQTANVTSSCSRAVITPALPVSNWTTYTGTVPIGAANKGTIYVASVPKAVTQVFLDGQLQSPAHYPDSGLESGWLTPTSVTKYVPGTSQTSTGDGTALDYRVSVSGLPSTDLLGATVSYRGPYPYALGSRVITGYSNGVMTLPMNKDPDVRCQDTEFGRYYLEGKLWMVNNPGEWAWSNGMLYLMMPKGQSPAGRVLATPPVNAVINARGSHMLALINVRVLGGRIGVDGGYTDAKARASDNLQIYGSEIAYSNWAGVYATGAAGLAFDGSTIYGSVGTGIYARSGVPQETYTALSKAGIKVTGSIVRNSRFTDINMIGMHKGGDGSIFLNHDNGALIQNNVITNSGKSGIYIGASKYSMVKDNTVDGACRIHGDCGGIYLSSRDKVALNTTVQNNMVKYVNGVAVRPGNTSPERYGIYLDDYTTGATIVGNTMNNNDSGMQLHMAFKNMITSNVFTHNVQRHVLLADDAGDRGSMKINIFQGNVFIGDSIVYFFAVANPTTAANLSGNNYTNSTPAIKTSPANIPIY